MERLSRILCFSLALLVSQVPTGAARAWASRATAAPAPSACCCGPACPMCAHHEGKAHVCKCRGGHGKGVSTADRTDLPWKASAKASKASGPKAPVFAKSCGSPEETPEVVIPIERAIPSWPETGGAPLSARRHDRTEPPLRLPVLAEEILHVPVPA